MKELEYYLVSNKSYLLVGLEALNKCVFLDKNDAAICLGIVQEIHKLQNKCYAQIDRLSIDTTG